MRRFVLVVGLGVSCAGASLLALMTEPWNRNRFVATELPRAEATEPPVTVDRSIPLRGHGKDVADFVRLGDEIDAPPWCDCRLAIYIGESDQGPFEIVELPRSKHASWEHAGIPCGKSIVAVASPGDGKTFEIFQSEDGQTWFHRASLSRPEGSGRFDALACSADALALRATYSPPERRGLRGRLLPAPAGTHVVWTSADDGKTWKSPSVR